MEHFVDRQPQDVAVDDGDAVQFPIFRVFLDDGVDLVAVFERAADERLGEEADGGLLGGGRGQFLGLAPGGDAFFLRDGGGLLRFPKLSLGRRQILRRIQIMLK